jgi:hypothetical protein
VLQEKIWRYQRGNQKPKIEEGQTTQWAKEKGGYTCVLLNTRGRSDKTQSITLNIFYCSKRQKDKTQVKQLRQSSPINTF